MAAGLLAVLVLAGAAQAAGTRPGWDSFLERVAATLGLPRDRVEEAFKQAAQGMVDEAVQSGRITPQQAEALRRRIQEGRWPWPFPLGRPHGGFHGKPWGSLLDPVARLLGLTPQQLREELRQGKTLAQVAQEHGKTRDQVKQAILEDARKKLEQAAAAGRLTRDRVEAKLQQLAGQLDALLDRTWVPHGKLGAPKTPAPGAPGGGSSSSEGAARG